MKIMAFSKQIVMVITNVLTLLFCSVRWGWDEDWSSTESLVGETAANSIYASRPKKIHQVSLQFYDPVQVWIFFFTRLLCQHPAESHDKSLHSLWFLWCLLVSSFTRTSTSSPHPLSFFSPLTFLSSPIIFLLLFFSPPVFHVPFFFPLHPSVHSYLWSLPIYYCEDQPVRITETSSQPHGKWQHLSSWYIRHSSERPLSSCLLFTWMVEAVCVCVCVSV